MRRAGAHALGDEPNPAQPHRDDAPVGVSGQTTRGVEKGTELPPELAAQVQRLRGGGIPLSALERALFEPLLGVDLGRVRIHTGLTAMQTARALHARAYTVGSDIAFGSGQYRPATDTGRRLLAHELVHTVQQRGYRPRGQPGLRLVQCQRRRGVAYVRSRRPRPVRGTGMGPLDRHPRYPVALGLLTGQTRATSQAWCSSSTSQNREARESFSAMNVAALGVSILMKQGGDRVQGWHGLSVHGLRCRGTSATLRIHRG